MESRRNRQLAAVDWDFVLGDETVSSGLHWYPGTFVPGLPAALIEALSIPGDTVFDPYGGVGTTGMAAIPRGRGVICSDLNPVAAIASFAGVSLLAMRFERPELFDAVFREAEALVEFQGSGQEMLSLRAAADIERIDPFVGHISDRTAHQLWTEAVIGPPIVEPLRRWYEPGTLAQLESLVKRSSAEELPYFVRLLGMVMASAVARQLSSQNRSWGHLADNVIPKEMAAKDVKRAAASWLKRTYTRLAKIRQVNPLPDVRPFIHPRILDWSETGPADVPSGVAALLVTSPPYAGAIDYILSQRLSLHLFGRSDRDIAHLCGKELGARRKRFVSSHVSSWAAGMSAALAKQTAVLKASAFAAFVMPHKDYGRHVGEDELKRMLAADGWSLIFERDRSIRQAKARQSWTSIKQETILIFERLGG